MSNLKDKLQKFRKSNLLLIAKEKIWQWVVKLTTKEKLCFELSVISKTFITFLILRWSMLILFPHSITKAYKDGASNNDYKINPSRFTKTNSISAITWWRKSKYRFPFNCIFGKKLKFFSFFSNKKGPNQDVIQLVVIQQLLLEFHNH